MIWIVVLLCTWWAVSLLLVLALSRAASLQSPIPNPQSSILNFSDGAQGLPRPTIFEAGSDVAAVAMHTDRSSTRPSHTPRLNTAPASMAPASVFGGENPTHIAAPGKDASCSGALTADLTTRAGMVPAVVDAAMEDSASHRAPQCPSARVVLHLNAECGTRNAEQDQRAHVELGTLNFERAIALNPRLLS